MTYKCPFCERTFSTRSSYSQHVASCMKTAEEEENIINSERNLSILSEQSILGSESSLNENNQSMLISEESESEARTEYPNLVYADLMTLVTKYKVNNATGK